MRRIATALILIPASLTPAAEVTLILDGTVAMIHGTPLDNIGGPLELGDPWQFRVTYDPARPADYDIVDLEWVEEIIMIINGFEIVYNEGELVIPFPPDATTLSLRGGTGPFYMRASISLPPGFLGDRLPGDLGPLPFLSGGMLQNDYNGYVNGTITSARIIPAPTTAALLALSGLHAARRRR